MNLTNEFIFSTFDEAMKVHNKVFEIMKQKNLVTFADLYFLINKDEKCCKEEWTIYGWKNLWDTKVEPCNNNWILRMPKIKKI